MCICSLYTHHLLYSSSSYVPWCMLPMASMTPYSALTAYLFQQSLSLSLCWSSLGTPHFLLTLVPNLKQAPCHYLINPSKRHKLDLGLRVKRTRTLPLLLPRLYRSFSTSHSCSLSLFPSAKTKYKKKIQSGEPAPSPCSSLGSWVRVFTQPFPIYFPNSISPSPADCEILRSHSCHTSNHSHKL